MLIETTLLAPALLLHFALVFPGRSETTIRSSAKLLAVYFLPVALLLIHVSTALSASGFVPWLGAYLLLIKIEFSYLAVCFLAADESSYITGQIWAINGGLDM